MTDQNWSDDRWREHNRMLREAGGVCVMPDQWKQVNELADAICASDQSVADTSSLSRCPKAVELARRMLEHARHHWTLDSCEGGMSEYMEMPEDLGSPPEDAIKHDFSLGLVDGEQMRQLYAVSVKFAGAFALNYPNQWPLVANKAMERNGCDAAWERLMRENAGLYDSFAPEGCAGTDAGPTTVYAVKFGEFISVVTLCDSCASKLKGDTEPEY